MIIKEIYEKVLLKLKEKKIPFAKVCASTIIANVLKIKRLDIFLFFEKKVSKIEEGKIFYFLKKKLNREPLEYIFPKIFFYNVFLEISKYVLIPRKETEYLVEKVVGILKKMEISNKTLFDIGTGSGAIAIALKKAFPSLNVIASDISLKALLIAKKNAKKNGVKVEFLQGDFFSSFIGKKADFIVSNPPYVSEKEYKNLPKEVLFEPKIALIAKNGGFEFYERFSNEVLNYVNKGAKIFLEIREADVREFENKGVFLKKYFKNQKILKDLDGRKRFFFLEIESLV